MTATVALTHEAIQRESYKPTGRNSSRQSCVEAAPRLRDGLAAPGIHLLPTAEAPPAPIAEQDPAALLRLALWGAIDRTGLRPLAHMLARYPKLATGLFLPALTMSFLFFLMSDFVALLLGLYSISMGLVFAVAAAREMARDGIDFAPTSNTEEAS